MIMNSTKGLNVIHLNIRSLLSKIDLLKVWLTYNKPQVITLSETWLNSSIADNEIKLEDYVLYRKDRGSRGGGLLIYVSSNLNSELALPAENPVFFEGLFVQINLHENKRLLIGNIYRPPNAPVESIKNIVSTINSFKCNIEKIILGDFNSNWLNRSTSNERNLLNSINLSQLITEPTRVGPCSATLLDWILVSHPDRFINSGVLPDSFSDHSVIFCTWKIKLARIPHKVIKIRIYHNINVELFIHDTLNINWDRLQLIPMVDDAWNFLYSEFMGVINKHAPWKTKRVKGRHLPWIKGELISLFKQRDEAWKRYRTTKDLSDWNIYKCLRNKCKTFTRNAKSNYYKDSLSTDFKNPKQFWRKINTIMNRPAGSPITHLNINNEIIREPQLVADAFSQHFSKVGSSFTYNSSEIYSDFTSVQNRPVRSFYFKKITPLQVERVINALNSNCSAGPDGLEMRFFKIASHILSFPLAYLFNLALETGETPSSWKCARVTPLHKGGDTQDVNNYRPISIINSITKIFEKLIFNQITTYLNDNNLLAPQQSGFRSNFSTSTALMKFTNDIFSSLDNNRPTGAIFIDLTKAFDMVDHYLLLDKLYAIGFSSDSLLFFNSFLHHRSHCVSFQGCQSDFRIVEKGVPQGSSLGPLLFSLFINDLPQACSNTQILLYADDTVLYFTNSSISQIQHTLQSDFNSMQKWFFYNKLLLNKSKSYSMMFCS